MAVTRRALQPANVPITLGEARPVDPVWIAFFDEITRRLATLDGLAAATVYANDAAAAAGGVALRGFYWDGTQVRVRVV